MNCFRIEASFFLCCRRNSSARVEKICGVCTRCQSLSAIRSEVKNTSSKSVVSTTTIKLTVDHFLSRCRIWPLYQLLLSADLCFCFSLNFFLFLLSYQLRHFWNLIFLWNGRRGVDKLFFVRTTYENISLLIELFKIFIQFTTTHSQYSDTIECAII